MKKLLVILTIGLSSCCCWAQPSQDLIVLIPGLFTHLLPDAPQSLQNNYPAHMVSKAYSEIYVKEFTQAGLDVLALNPLDWKQANVPEQVDIVTQKIQRYLQSSPIKYNHIFLLGHSAGGLVALGVADRLGNRVQKIFEVATPFNGSPVADALSSSLIAREIVNFADSMTSEVFELAAIKWVNYANSHRFLSSLHLSPKLEIYAYAGEQPKNSTFWPSSRAELLSMLYLPLQFLMPNESDGVIDLGSALPQARSLGKSLTQPVHLEGIISLDHAELAIDSRSLERLLGTTHAQLIDKQQLHLVRDLILPRIL